MQFHTTLLTISIRVVRKKKIPLRENNNSGRIEVLIIIEIGGKKRTSPPLCSHRAFIPLKFSVGKFNSNFV